MTILARGFCLLAFALAVVCGEATAGCFVQPTLSGTTPSGLDWSAVATGTALPIRTSGSQDLAPGAVLYMDTTTGLIQFDPKGWSVSLFNLTYSTGTNSAGAAGPFFVSGQTFPEGSQVSGTGSSITRLAATSGLVSASLAIGGCPTRASTNGFWDLPWAFPFNTATGGGSTLDPSNMKVFGVTGNANANILGYGNYRSVFQYTVNGVIGNQVGAVIPVVPEPSTLTLAGVACFSMVALRRRNSSCRNEGRGANP